MRRLLDLLSPIPWPPWVLRKFGQVGAAWLRRTHGRGPLASDVLLLTTRGRKSGRSRSTALLHFERAGHRYVVASFGGGDRAPAWFLNLVADPNVTVEMDGLTMSCEARVLPAHEADALWPYLDEAFHGFARYRRRTDRPIPIIELVDEGTPPVESA